MACAFDSDFAKVSGLRVRLINYLMTVFVAVCVVLTIRLVGIMLLIAMLTLPILIAETWRKRFSAIMIASIAVSILSSVGGLMLATLWDVPCSAIIVLHSNCGLYCSEGHQRYSCKKVDAINFCNRAFIQR